MDKIIKGSVVILSLSSTGGFWIYGQKVGMIDLSLFGLSLLSLGMIAGMEIGRLMNRETKSNKQSLDFWDIVKKSRGEL